MKSLFAPILLVLLTIPLAVFASNDTKGSSFFQDLKHAGKEAKESAKEAGKDIKKGVKETGKEIKKSGKKAKEDLKKAGKDIKKETKKSGKGFTNTLKNSFKRAGRAVSDAWHGFLDFLGIGKDKNDKKKDIPSGKVNLDSVSVA